MFLEVGKAFLAVSAGLVPWAKCPTIDRPALWDHPSPASFSHSLTHSNFHSPWPFPKLAAIDNCLAEPELLLRRGRTGLKAELKLKLRLKLELELELGNYMSWYLNAH